MENEGYKIRVKGYINFSDYTRPLAVRFARVIAPTRVKLYQVNLTHFVLMLLAVYQIYLGNYFVAAVLILLKNLIDAMDGSLARVRGEVSLTGRYFDSNLDFVGNALLFLFLPQLEPWQKAIAFLFFVIQGSFFHYYYKLFSQNRGEDNKTLAKDNPRVLKFLLITYKVFYGWQDYIVRLIDEKVLRKKDDVPAPWYLSLLSFNGLGFQHLVIIILLVFSNPYYIYSYFVYVMSLYLLFLLFLRLIKKRSRQCKY